MQKADEKIKPTGDIVSSGPGLRSGCGSSTPADAALVLRLLYLKKFDDEMQKAWGKEAENKLRGLAGSRPPRRTAADAPTPHGAIGRGGDPPAITAARLGGNSPGLDDCGGIVVFRFPLEEDQGDRRHELGGAGRAR